MATHDSPPEKHAGNRRGLTRFALFVLLAGLLLLAACGMPDSIPLIGDDDGQSATTPVATEADIPTADDSSTPVPVPTERVEREDGGWTVIRAPERPDIPAERGSEQQLRMTGPTDPPSTLDPALVRDTSSSFIARQVFRGLVRLNSELDPVPDLAEQVEIFDDGRTYRFTLHEGLRFHDGSPILASDVKASLERAADPALTDGDGSALPARNYLDDIEGARERMDGERDDIPGIVVVDDRTIEFHLARGVVDFLERLANPSTFIVDVEDAASGPDWWQSPNGSGPFRLQDWDPDRRIQLAPHNTYVYPPVLSRVSIRIGAEAVGQMQLYETGEIDLVNVPISALDRVDYDGMPIDGDLRAEPLISTTMALINPQIEPFSIEQLRQAMMYAFPRHQIPDVMLDGRARRASGIVPPEMELSTISEFNYDYDPEQARALFEEAGGEAIGPLAIYTSGGSIPAAMKQYYEGGFETPVEVVELRWSDYLSDLESRDLPFFVLTWVADGPDPAAYLRALFHSQSPDNYAGFADERVDELLDEAAVEQDEDLRDEMLSEVHQRILDSAVVMPLYHSVDFILVGSHVNGLETTPMGILGLESVWIER